MKAWLKIFSVAVAAFTLFLIIRHYYPGRAKTISELSSRERILYTLGGKTYTLLAARTKDEHNLGLSRIRSNHNFDGMIFYFDPPAQVAFWNKDTFLGLELIWLNSGAIIDRTDLPNMEKAGLVIKTSPGAVTEVIEIIHRK